MADRNFKVVAVLRDDLTPAQRLTAERQLCALQRKFQIEKIDDETYCKGGPVTWFCTALTKRTVRPI